jgi:hypothetical protein
MVFNSIDATIEAIRMFCFRISITVEGLTSFHILKEKILPDTCLGYIPAPSPLYLRGPCDRQIIYGLDYEYK